MLKTIGTMFVILVAALTIIASGVRAQDAKQIPLHHKVDTYIKAEMKKHQIPGLALAVVKNGKVIKAKGYGLANVELNVPVTPNTVFDLSSVTKQFTATAIMLLVEEGKIGLDDKISKYLPNAPDIWSGITVRHLLTHTAGLKYYVQFFKGRWLADYTTADDFEYFIKLPVSFAPGERAEHNNGGYFLLGMIIEKVSGKRYLEFLRERIFKPLGMTATTMLDQYEIIKNFSPGYALSDGKLVHNRRYAQIELDPANGIVSTVEDLAKWAAALYTERILKKSSRDQMWTPVKLNNGFSHNFGFGWILDDVLGHKVVEHGGFTGTEIFHLPDDKLTVIVLTNLWRLSDPRSIAQRVAGFYVPGILLSSLKEQPDPDAEMTQKLRNLLSDLAASVEDLPLITPEAKVQLSQPVIRRKVASWLKDLKSFTLVACDDVQERRIDRFGVRVSRVCYYKLVNALETRYLWFCLTADGKVAHLSSNTE